MQPQTPTQLHQIVLKVSNADDEIFINLDTCYRNSDSMCFNEMKRYIVYRNPNEQPLQDVIPLVVAVIPYYPFECYDTEWYIEYFITTMSYIGYQMRFHNLTNSIENLIEFCKNYTTSLHNHTLFFRRFLTIVNSTKNVYFSVHEVLGQTSSYEPQVLRLSTKNLFQKNLRNIYNMKMCVMCMDCSEEEPLDCELTCGHVFHLECVKGWVEQHGKCPVCKCHV